MSRCDLNLWPLDLELLQHLGCHMCHKLYKIWVKSNNPLLSCWRFSTFSPYNFKSRARLTNGSQGCVTQLHQTFWGRRAIIPTQEICFSVRISCCIFKRERLKVEWCRKRRKISQFMTSVKIRGRMDKISIPVVKALPTTEPPKYIWWPSTALLLSAVDW